MPNNVSGNYHRSIKMPKGWNDNQINFSYYIEYTQNAIKNLRQYGLEKARKLEFDAKHVFEWTIYNQTLHKVAIRQDYSAEQDIIYVVQVDGSEFVRLITVYLIPIHIDPHYTIPEARYIQ